jgi:long-chain acyl-CoA synthetase
MSPVVPDVVDPRADPAMLNGLIGRMSRSSARFTILQRGERKQCNASELYEDIMAMSAMLRDKYGLPARSRVGIRAENCYEWMVLDLACIASGIVTVPFDPHGSSDAMALIDYFALSIFVTDKPEEEGGSDKVVPLGALRGQTGDHRQMPGFQYRRDDIVTVKFTSGSTQQPKAIEAKAINIENSIANVQRLFRHDASDRILVCLPLYLLQQRFWIYSAILFDFHIVLTNPSTALMSLQRERPTVVMGVPELFELIRQQFLRRVARNPRLWAGYTLYATADVCLGGALRKFGFRPFLRTIGGSVRYLWTGSAACSIDTLRFYDEMGVRLLQGYGMNETCIVSKNGVGTNRIGSAGRLLPNYEVEFDDDGQIIVRNACEVATSYYRGSPELNEETFLPGGAVKTGDLGYIDADGYLFITGRMKDLIVLTSGRKVAPGPIEARLRQSMLVENCMVLGSERPYCVAIIKPANANVAIAEIEAEVAKVNAAGDRDERIVKFVVSTEGFSRENGLLTSQFKLRRNEITQRYAPQIAELY